jgi:predicted metalloprotease with PDZ domain
MNRLLLVLAAFVLPCTTFAQTPSIEYTLSARNPISHLYDVRIEIRGVRSTTLDVAMPAWSPGVYAIRDFAGNVQQLEALTRQNRPLRLEQLDKQTWRISKASDDDVRLRYRVYSGTLTDEMADVLPAAVFMVVAGHSRIPLTVRYETEGNWEVYTGLEKRGDRYLAPDYDTLAASPAFLGDFKVLEFQSGDIPYRVVFSNPRTQMTEPQVEADLEDLANAAASMFGTVPFREYVFLVRVQSTTGAASVGYLNSSRLSVGENDFANRSAYAAFLSAAAQGLVKAWYGRATRPGSMSPYDYSHEAYTRLLWFNEGVAAYSADLLLLRSGILNSAEYLQKASVEVNALQHQPGRLLMSLEDASWNTWTRSGNSANSTVSYLLKGKIAGLLLDAEIRGSTSGRQSLDGVLRHFLMQGAPAHQGLADDALEPAIQTATGINVGEFFDAVVRGKGEIDYNLYLQKIGLEVSAMKGPATISYGMEFERIEANQARVRRVFADSPAETAKVDTGDILLALDSEHVTYDNVVARLHSRPLGKTVSLAILRGDRLMTLSITPGATQTETWSLGESLTTTPEQQRLREAWIDGLPR